MPSVPVRQHYLFVIFFDTKCSEATEGSCIYGIFISLDLRDVLGKFA